MVWGTQTFYNKRIYVIYTIANSSLHGKAFRHKDFKVPRLEAVSH